MVAQGQGQDRQRIENLGPAERIVQVLTTSEDHLVHNRPGVVFPDNRFNTGIRWEQAARKKDDEGRWVVSKVTTVRKKKTLTRLGVLDEDEKTVRNLGGQVICEYRKPGIMPEVAAYLYGQVAEAYKMDQEFVARWASWQFKRDSKDLKVILAAFLLVQERCGDPVTDGGEVLFFDDDYRAVGEAMCLLTGTGYLDAKLLNRIGDVLKLDEVASINRDLGFGRSARTAPLGRYRKALNAWLQYRENNPRMLEGLVAKGQRQLVMRLAQRCRYKPQTAKFFEILRWRQKQSNLGHRSILGVDVAEAESWDDLDERAICERIVKTRPDYKRVVGLVPKGLGITRAIMAATVESGGLSKADLIMLTPTLEELGLLDLPAIKTKWQAACQEAENMRAANIAKNVKSKEAREGLQEAADKAVVKALEEPTKDLEVFVVVDKSASMEGAIERAKAYLAQFLQGFPLDHLHISIFNTVGTVLSIKSARRAAVEHSFKGHHAGGGTSYAAGVMALRPSLHRIEMEKGEPERDNLMLFVGDQEDTNTGGLVEAAREFHPVAFGLLEVKGTGRWAARFDYHIVEDAARALQIPCFKIDEHMFDDPYAVTRILRNLIANTPVGARPAGRPVTRRVTLVEQILREPLLAKPVWAA